MSDIVERLRERAASGVNCLCGNPVCDEAAEEILRLRAENEKLRAALRPFADMMREVSDAHEDHNSIEECGVLTAGQIRAAAAALNWTETPK